MRSRLVWMFAIAALVAAPLTGMGPAARRATSVASSTTSLARVLPGVTVTLRGPAVQGAPIAVTNELGRLPVPEPARRASTRSPPNLPGFSTRTQTGIQVALGATAGSAGADGGEHPAGDHYGHGGGAGGRFGHDARWPPTTRASGSRTPGAPLHVLRPDQRLARRVAVHADQLALAGLRLGRQREPLPARRHRLHGAAHRRGVAVAQHRRHRRSAGAVARRLGRVRQRRRRRLQHRHPPGVEPVPRRHQLLLSEQRSHRPQHQHRPGRRSALQPRPLPRLDDAARRRRSSRTSCGSSGRSSTRPTGNRSPARPRPSRPSRTPSATSGS